MLIHTYPVTPNWERVCTFEDFPSTLGPGDQTLISFLHLVLSSKEDMMQRVILDHSLTTSKLERSDFKQILEIVERNVTVTKTGTGKTSPILSKETFVEFHNLTLAAFKGFAYTFQRLGKAIKDLVGIDY